MKRYGLGCFMLLAAVVGCAATRDVSVPPAPLKVESFAKPRSAGAVVARLSNGMTVIVSENRNAPVVCVRAYVRAGSMYEGKYLGTGISHLCEHIVAKGAKRDGTDVSRAQGRRESPEIGRIGGQSNAYTTLGHTSYYISAAAGKTDECIDLIAGWMAEASISPEDFRREHGVVQRELEMRGDEPEREFRQAHMRNTFDPHPAAIPVVGYPKPLSELTLADVRDYHRRMYVPQNMVFVVVGDVQADKVLKRIGEAFAGFEVGRATELISPEVPPTAGTRRAVLRNKTVTETMETVGFRTIPLIHKDLYALDVLSYILATGRSSLLVRTVQNEKRLVTSISSSSWTPAWGAGQFAVQFRCKPDLADQAERAVLAELRKVVADGVTQEQLDRAKRQKVADYVYSQQTVESQAATLATDYLSAGNVDFSRLYTDRIGKVTVEQVNAVAGKYFDFDRMVVTRMVPEGFREAAAKPASSAGTARTACFTLPNGLRVVLRSSPSVDLVSMVLATRGGLLLETPRTNGMGTLMTLLSTKGAGDLSARRIDEFFDSAGGSVSGQCGNNTFYWQATVLGDSFTRALPIFADVVLRPTFPAKELRTWRPILLAAIRKSRENWNGLLRETFRRDFFGDSPLAMTTAGSADVVAKATGQSIADYHDRYVRTGASVLTIYGNFDLGQARKSVEGLFSAMPAGDNDIPDVSPRLVKPAGQSYFHKSKLQGAGIMVAAPGMKISDLDDRLAITVLDTIISGYRLPGGWLHEQLRGAQLVYVVHAYNWPSLVPGAFVVYAQSKPETAGQVARIIRQNLRKTLSYPFTQDEVDQAVNTILTADLLENQAVGSLAMQAALDELYGFGYDFRKKYEKMLRKITPADVTRVANKYLSGGYVTTVVTPDPELLEGEN